MKIGSSAESPAAGQRAPSLRRFPRYPFQFPFLYRVPGTSPPPVGVGWTRHLSEAGAGVELGEPLSPGTPLTLLVQTPRGPLELQAQVVWTGKRLEAGGGILQGLVFTATDAKLLHALRNLFQVLNVFQDLSGAPRGGIRLPIATLATCQAKYPPGPLLQGRTGDISREGLLLLLPEAMPAGTVLAMTLDTPRGPVSLEGVVAWQDSPGIATPGKSVRHGVRLTSRDWATAVALGRLLAELA